VSAQAIHERFTLSKPKSVPYVNNGFVWQVIATLPTPLIMVNHLNLITYMNKQAERFFGMSHDDAVGKPWSHVVYLHESGGRPIALQPNEMRNATHLPDSTGWWLVKSTNGREIPVQLSVALIDDPDAHEKYGIAVIFHELSEMRHLVEHLLHQCSHDPLTGLVNRSEFETRLARAVESAVSGQKSHALLFMDLDNFKRVNDQFGHQYGDALLQTIAGRFRSIVRDRDTLARFGGDEFLLLLEHCDIGHAVETARLLQLSIRDAPVFCSGKAINSDVSIGIVPIQQHSPSPETLIAQADAACYVAKRKLQTHIRVYDHGDAEMAFALANTRNMAETNEIH
jgi:diguanylate cyclase (GGDEF)-like protein/PAS domain S-box-containing protein